MSTITISVQNSKGAWEVIEREPALTGRTFLVDPCEVDAGDIGGSPGQSVLVELRDDNDVVLDSRELAAY